MFNKLRFRFNDIEILLEMDGNYRIKCTVDNNSYFVKPELVRSILDLIEECELDTWHKNYHPEGYVVLDGYSWELEYRDKKYNIFITGNNAYPWCFYKLINALLIAAPSLEERLGEFKEEKKAVYDC